MAMANGGACMAAKTLGVAGAATGLGILSPVRKRPGTELSPL
jgi:hypothetical protein